MTFRFWGLMVAVCLQVAMPNGIGRSRMLFLEPGETLSGCHKFQWRSMPSETHVVLSVGSCPGCNDIFLGQESAAYSSTVALPFDGRDVHVRLSTVVKGAVVDQVSHVYRAPTALGDGERLPCDAKRETTVGIYHWAGKAARSLTQGVEAIAEMGGSAVRLSLSPRTRRDYNGETGCISEFRLAEFLEDADVRQALSNESIETFMLTVYDGASFQNCQDPLFLRPPFHTPENNARLVKEYSDFAYELIRTDSGSGKTFIVSNWESDNLVYCGSSYAYATNREFRRTCDADYAVTYGGNAGPAESLLGLKHWFSARSKGIAEGRRRAAGEGYAGVAVYVAPEINSVRHLRDARLANVLTNVLPFVEFDYVSYSSWESLNKASAPDELAADLDTVRTIAGTDAVIVGELGYATAYFGETATQRVSGALSSATKWGAPYVFHWVLYDDPSGSGYGLFDTNGALTPIGWYFKNNGLRYVAGGGKP